MVRISFEWLESLLNCLNFLSNGSIPFFDGLNFVGMVRIGIRMVRIPFEWLGFAFEWLEFLSNGLNLHSNLVRMVQICILILRISFEQLKFAFNG